MTAQPERRLQCSGCGASFGCSPGAGCWCAQLPPALPVPSDGVTDCLCPACLRERIAAAADRAGRMPDGESARPGRG